MNSSIKAIAGLAVLFLSCSFANAQDENQATLMEQNERILQQLESLNAKIDSHIGQPHSHDQHSSVDQTHDIQPSLSDQVHSHDNHSHDAAHSHSEEVVQGVIEPEYAPRYELGTEPQMSYETGSYDSSSIGTIINQPMPQDMGMVVSAAPVMQAAPMTFASAPMTFAPAPAPQVIVVEVQRRSPYVAPMFNYLPDPTFYSAPRRGCRLFHH